MKFIEGLILGGMVGTGIALVYTDNCNSLSSKKILKKGRQIAKKMGIY